MFETYAPILANGVGVSALLAGLFWMLASGRLATGREIREKNKRIEKLESALEIRDAQLDTVLKEYLPAANSVMSALHQAAGEVADR